MKMKRMILALAAVLAFGFIGCNNHTCPIQATVHPDLQRALVWVNCSDREWTKKNADGSLPGLTSDVPFGAAHSDLMIRGDRTFRQFATHALLDAWIDTYQHNTAAWTPAKWKEIIGNAPTTGNAANSNSTFASSEVPLIIR